MTWSKYTRQIRAIINDFGNRGVLVGEISPKIPTYPMKPADSDERLLAEQLKFDTCNTNAETTSPCLSSVWKVY